MKQFLKLPILWWCLGALWPSFTASAQSGVDVSNTINTGMLLSSVGVSPNQFNVDGTYTTVSPAVNYFNDASGSGTAIEISGNTAPAFYDLVFANGASSSALISNTTGIDVANTLQLQNGITNSSSSAAAMAIRLGATATTTGSSAFSTTRYINGYMSKAGGTAFTFPMGNGGKYSPATFTNPSGSTINYQVGSPGNTSAFATQGTGIQLVTVSAQEFYNSSNVNGSAPLGSSITIPYNNFGPAGYVGDPTALTIAGWNGTQWVNLSGVTTDQSGGSSGHVTVVLASALSGFTKFALASTRTTNALPVSFSSFTANNVNCTALLKWTTSTVVTSSYYSIEASTDGIGFKEVTRVANQNNSIGVIYTANLSLTGATNYYRINAVEVDGRISFSTEVQTLKSTCADRVKIAVWPNPSKDNISVYGLSGKNTLTISNAFGQKMATLSNTTASQLVPISNYPSGIYFISVISETGSIQQVKFVKQ